MTTVLSTKEIVCPACYLGTKLTLSTEPRIPATGMMWLCRECETLSVFDDKLDLREATEAERAKAIL